MGHRGGGPRPPAGPVVRRSPGPGRSLDTGHHTLVHDKDLHATIHGSVVTWNL
ncbi:MAG TPA: hypothetical protein VK045_07820 [Ornithinicoccus sp.]|nr:hypothetical protein [Ornithinicoccus sp.]